MHKISHSAHGRNTPNTPKHTHGGSGPAKDTADGASLKTGYKVLSTGVPSQGTPNANRASIAK